MRLTIQILVVTYEGHVKPSAYAFFTREEAEAQAVTNARQELEGAYEDEVDFYHDLEKLVTPTRFAELEAMGFETALDALGDVEALDMAKDFTAFDYEINPSFLEATPEDLAG